MTVSIIGYGNIAFHLGKRLLEKGLFINQIIGRNADKASWLAGILGTGFETDFTQINPQSDIYIIAVSDSAIPSVSKQLSQVIDNQLVVHTSGSIPSTVLSPFFENFGTFYPLQTFSLSSQPDFDTIPIFINTNSNESLVFLQTLGKQIAHNIYELADEKRIVLHISAVFVNNFTNHLFQIGYDILEKEHLPFDVLKPLILETVHKIQNHKPKDMQTGPAKRGDLVTIEKHLEYLKNNFPPEVGTSTHYYELYKIFSESIVKISNS